MNATIEKQARENQARESQARENQAIEARALEPRTGEPRASRPRSGRARRHRTAGVVMVEYAFLLTFFGLPVMLATAAAGIKLIQVYGDIRNDALHEFP